MNTSQVRKSACFERPPEVRKSISSYATVFTDDFRQPATPGTAGFQPAIRHWYAVAALALLLTGCGDQPRTSATTSTKPTTATATVSKRPTSQNEDENARWVIFGTDVKGPSPASLQEAQQMDDIRGLMDATAT